MLTIKESALLFGTLNVPHAGSPHEVGQPADAHTIHCEICMGEGRQIRLKRSAGRRSDHASTPPGSLIPPSQGSVRPGPGMHQCRG